MNSASSFSRRSLLGAAGILTAASYSRILGANDRIRLGVAGCGGRGRYVGSLFLKDPAVEVAALCDVYGARIEQTREKYATQIGQAGKKVPGFADHRKMLDEKDIDVVLVGTPDHWHADIAIDALAAGKDVYVEKPLMYRREEGPRIVRATRTSNRICQVGLQQRSGPQYIKVRDEYVKPGKLGRITYVRTWWHGGMQKLVIPEMKEKPADLDWARYLGQVRWRDWNPVQYFNFRDFLDFGGGMLTDLFTHWIDAVHMMLDNDALQAIMVAGGLYHNFGDGRDAPDTLSVTCEYRGPFNVTFELASLPNMPAAGIELCGTEGRVFVSRSGLEYRSAEKGAPPVEERVPLDNTIDHVQNFLECCRTRKAPNCDPYVGHRSTQVALLAVQAYVEKRRVHFDPDREIVLP